MRIRSLIFVFIALLSFNACAVTYTGANLPFDSLFYMGLVSGPGTGVNIGADVFFPTAVSNLSAGADLQIEITNSEFEQNISVQKYGVVGKYAFSDDLFLTFYLGWHSFYLTKQVDFIDSFSGGRYTLEDDTHGAGTYWGLSPNFRLGEYFISPRLVVNCISTGGNIFEVDLNISHRF